MHSTPSETGTYVQSRRRRMRAAPTEANRSLLSARWHIRSDWVAEGFREFGEHCARNQIRVLLIDCLVMTNLFYPSLTLYLTKKHAPPDSSSSSASPKDGPLSLFSTPLLDSFFPYPPPLLPRLEVQRGRWWESSTAESSRDAQWIAHRLTSAQQRSKSKGKGKAVEGDLSSVVVLRVAWTTVDRVLDGDRPEPHSEHVVRDDDMARAVRDLADKWNLSSLATPGEACVRNWHEDATQGQCVAMPAVDDGLYRTISILLHSPDTDATLARRWMKGLESTASQRGGEVFAESRDYRSKLSEYQASIWSLSLNTTRAPISTLGSTEAASTPNLILALYAILILTLLRQLSNATKVHSRFGLAFTGVVELTCSTVMSFSVLGLLGWADNGDQEGRGLPVYMMPFVIVVVGVENMSTLTKAVFSIPFSYSVPDRIGLALAKVGATLTLTSLADLALLAIVGYFVNIRAVREFCLFAGIVIFVDWWMLHTFFLTVLSIDAQRLELADVLQSQNMPKKLEHPRERVPSGESSLKSIGTGFKAVIMGRTARGFSLILLLVFLSGLFYVTESHRSSSMSTANLYGYWPSTSSSGSATTTSELFPSVTTTDEFHSMTAAEQLWLALNPFSRATIDIVIPPAAIVVLPSEGHALRPADLRHLSLPTARLIIPRLKPIFYFLKIFILPQALTAGTLYLILLYLLKDADLLDAQRDRPGRAEGGGNDHRQLVGSGSSLASKLRFSMLPPEHEADIELLAASGNGSVVVSVSFDSTIRLWRAANDGALDAFCETLPKGMFSSTEDDPIVQLAVSDDGDFAVVGTALGHLLAWTIPQKSSPQAVAISDVSNFPSKVSGLMILSREHGLEDPFAAHAIECVPLVVVAMSDGAILEVTQEGTRTGIVSTDKSSSWQAFLFPPSTDSAARVMVTDAEQAICWRRSSKETWEEECRFQSASISSLAVRSLVVNDITWVVIAAGHLDGSTVLFDGLTGDIIARMDVDEMIRHAIRKIDIASPDNVQCSGCGHQSSNGFFVVSSTQRHVMVDRVTFRQGSAFCKCSTNGQRGHSLSVDRSLLSPNGHVPNTDSTLVLPPSPHRMKTSPSASPRRLSSLPPPVLGDFPVSAHGYTRRSNVLHRDPDAEESPRPLVRDGSLDFSSITESDTSCSPKWSDVSVQSLGAVVSEKGDWAIVEGESVVGVRKGGRGGFPSETEWQVWAIDLASAWDGHRLNVSWAKTSVLQEQTYEISRRSIEIADQDDAGDVSLRRRRARRLLSLTNSSDGSSTGRLSSASLARPPSLSHHTVWPLIAKGNGIVAGFGNRLGVAMLPARSHSSHLPSPGAGQWSNSRAFPFPTTPTSLPPPPPSSASRRTSIINTLGLPIKSKQN